MIAALLACALITAEPEPQTLAFCVETEIVSGPISQVSANASARIHWLTIFDGILAVDSEFERPKSYTVYDFARGEITKLDTARQKKSTISFGELENYVANIRLGLNAAAVKNFGADVFPQRLPGDRWQAILPGWRYDVAGQIEPMPQAAQRYALFANHAARLNVVDHQGRPPFVRIRLNEELAQNRLLPLEITITGNVSQKSTHRVTTGLNETQKKRVAEVASMLQQFTETDWKSLSN